jgi:hypothetical protein
MLTDSERATLANALDALLPAEGSFPWPSATGIIDEFFLKRVPLAGTLNPEWPGLNVAGLRAILATLAGVSDLDAMTVALAELERNDHADFLALWRLAVFGYYSRPEVIAAIAADLAPDYHGAPLPLGYAHLLTPWDASDPMQLPRHPRGSYVPTEAVQRVDLERLRAIQEREAGA